MIKFQNDCAKIVEFLLVVNFWVSLVFFASVSTGWKESIGHGSKLKGFLAHIYADLTDLT